jgi:hypothetical protein
VLWKKFSCPARAKTIELHLDRAGTLRKLANGFFRLAAE